MEFNSLDLGIQSTQQFSFDDSSALEGLLNGNAEELVKIDEEKEKKAAEEKQKVDAAKKAVKSEVKKEEAEEPEEDPIDVLEELDQEKKSKGKEKKETPASPEEEETEDNEFQTISKNLYQLGVFTPDEETGEVLAANGDELATLFQQNAQKAAFSQLDNFLRSRGDDRLDLFQSIFVDGVDPREYLPLYNQVLNFQDMDISQEANQEKAYREYYTRLGWNAEKIDARLQKLKDYGDLAEEATDIHQKLLEQDKQKLLDQAEKAKLETAQKQQADQTYRESLRKVLVEGIKAKELDGVPLNEKTAQQVASYLTTPVWKLPNGEVLTEFDKFILESKRPENIRKRALIALLETTGWDFSKIEKRGVSKEASELFSGLAKKAVKSNTKKVVNPEHYFGASL